MLYDDRVVSTPHIWLVPCKEYRWGGLQWHFVYIDFHKHQFINVCNVSVLYTYITVCLQPDLTLNLLTTTIVAPPSNASKWQMGFNSAFKGLILEIISL